MSIISTPSGYGSPRHIAAEVDIGCIERCVARSALMVPAEQTPQELADAKDLKGKIAVFLHKQVGKTAGKAKNIVKHLPTNDPRQLGNILKALKVLLRGNERFERLKDSLSWENDLSGLLVGNCIRNTTSEDRLVLRALSLYNFAGLDAELYDNNREAYLAALRLSVANCHFIKARNHGDLEENYFRYTGFLEASPGDVRFLARVAVLPTILSEMDKLYRA